MNLYIYFKDGEGSILAVQDQRDGYVDLNPGEGSILNVEDQRDSHEDLNDGESSILVVEDQGDGQVDLNDQVQDDDDNPSFKETELPNSNQYNIFKTFKELNDFFDKVCIKITNEDYKRLYFLTKLKNYNKGN